MNEMRCCRLKVSGLCRDEDIPIGFLVSAAAAAAAAAVVAFFFPKKSLVGVLLGFRMRYGCDANEG